MAWATVGNVTTTHLDSADDSPAQARVELLNALLELQNVINGRGAVNGVASLDANTKVPSAQMPDEINSSGSTDLTLDPATGIVAVEDIIKLNPITRTAAYAVSNLADGMMAMMSDGDSTVTKPAYYSGGVWRYFDDNTEVPSS
tara:strand:- start:1307 stop:1738 length:432 start_codon:yes stop_codon:yes gene_type:complete